MKDKANMTALIAAICSTMRSMAVDTISLEYSGCGDSGNGLEINAGTLESTPLFVRVLREHFANNRVSDRSSAERLTVQDAFAMVWDAAIALAGHRGWEDGDGGHGHLRIEGRGVAVLEHRDNHETSDTHNYVIAADVAVADHPNLQSKRLALCERMKERGVAEIEASYVGGGDSGGPMELCDMEAMGPEPINCLLTSSKWCQERAEFVNEEPAYRAGPPDQLFEALADEVIEHHGHAGYFDGAGGGGTIILRASGELVHEHYDIGYEEDASATVFWLPDADAVEVRSQHEGARFYPLGRARKARVDKGKRSKQKAA